MQWRHDAGCECCWEQLRRLRAGGGREGTSFSPPQEAGRALTSKDRRPLSLGSLVGPGGRGWEGSQRGPCSPQPCPQGAASRAGVSRSPAPIPGSRGSRWQAILKARPKVPSWRPASARWAAVTAPQTASGCSSLSLSACWPPGVRTGRPCSRAGKSSWGADAGVGITPRVVGDSGRPLSAPHGPCAWPGHSHGLPSAGQWGSFRGPQDKSKSWQEGSPCDRPGGPAVTLLTPHLTHEPQVGVRRRSHKSVAVGPPGSGGSESQFEGRRG